MKSTFRTRRDLCYSVGRRMATLDIGQSAKAWIELASEIERLGEMDVPKFKHLVWAIRRCTISGRQFNVKVSAVFAKKKRARISAPAVATPARP